MADLYCDLVPTPAQSTYSGSFTTGGPTRTHRDAPGRCERRTPEKAFLDPDKDPHRGPGRTHRWFSGAPVKLGSYVVLVSCPESLGPSPWTPTQTQL